MFGLKWRSLLVASAVACGAVLTVAEPVDAGWGYGYGGFVAPVRAYRPAYSYVAPRYVAPRYVAPRYVAPLRRAYRPVVPVVPVVRIAPIPAVPYQMGYRGYSPYGLYNSGYRGGVGIGIGVAPVGYLGY